MTRWLDVETHFRLFPLGYLTQNHTLYSTTPFFIKKQSRLRLACFLQTKKKGIYLIGRMKYFTHTFLFRDAEHHDSRQRT